jgi:hypothetical protein
MNVLLTILGFAAALALTILKALAMDEVRGRIQRHISASIEATIASLPPDLAAEWAEEWRAELAAVKSMPVAAARLARGLRHSASQLIGEPPFARVEARAGPQPSRSALKHVPQCVRSPWHRREKEGNRRSALASDRLALLSSSSTALSWRSPASPASPASPRRLKV